MDYEKIEKACENHLEHRMSPWPRVSFAERPSESASESPEMHLRPWVRHGRQASDVAQIGLAKNTKCRLERNSQFGTVVEKPAMQNGE